MSKLGILGATALSLALAIATPAWAGGVRGGGGHFGGGMHAGGGTHMGGFGGGGFRGAQASIGPGRGGGFARRGGHFAQGGGRGYGPAVGFAAGLAAGSVLGYGDGGYDTGYYGPSYYGDDYAYNNDYDDGATGYVVVPNSPGPADPAYCAQRYRSYDPASGTYLGFDGLRHPC